MDYLAEPPLAPPLPGLPPAAELLPLLAPFPPLPPADGRAVAGSPEHAVTLAPQAHSNSGPSTERAKGRRERLQKKAAERNRGRVAAGTGAAVMPGSGAG